MMTFDGNLKQEELTAAHVVARRVELDSVEMSAGSFSLKVPSETLLEGLRVEQVNIAHRYSFSSEKNLLSVFVHYVCHAKDAQSPKVEDKEAANAFELEATYILQYRLTVTPPPEEQRDSFFLGFAKVNGVYNSWPYLREFVQSCAARTGVASVTLPVFRVPQLPQNQPKPVEAIKQAQVEQQTDKPASSGTKRKKVTGK